MTANKKALAVMKESLQSPPSKSKFLAVGVAGGIALAGSAEAALQSLTMTVFTDLRNGAPSNSITYRLFADLEAGAAVTRVSGNSSDPLLIGLANNGASFYQNANGGPTSTDLNNNFFPFVPSMEWDSYVSIGALNQTSNTLTSVGGLEYLTFEGGDDLTTNSNGGYWAVSPGDAQSLEDQGQVFLGQFTVLGGSGTVDDLIGQINLQGLDSGGTAWEEIGASWSTAVVPEPSTALLMSLGLTGLAAKRRRRNRS